jgi:hypothetical protein
VEPQSLDSLSAEQLRGALLSMLQAAAAKDQELAFKQTLIDKLTHENALLKRMKFAAQSERAYFGECDRSFRRIVTGGLRGDFSTVSAT